MSKDQNRADFPVAAAMIDQFREVFGPGVKLLWAEENGKSIGRKLVDRIADQRGQEDSSKARKW